MTGDQPAVPEDVMQEIVAEVVAETRNLTDRQVAAVNAIRRDFYDRLEHTHSEAVGLIMQATNLPIAAADWLLCSDQPAQASTLPPEAFQ